MNVYYIDTHGADSIALRAGIQWLINQCEIAVKEGIIASPQKNSISNALKVFGFPNPSLNSFLQNERTNYGTISLRLLTKNTIIPCTHDGICLAIHPNQGILKIIDDIPRLTSVLIIPWLINECQDWLTAKNATQIKMQPSIDK